MFSTILGINCGNVWNFQALRRNSAAAINNALADAKRLQNLAARDASPRTPAEARKILDAMERRRGGASARPRNHARTVTVRLP